jgi:hemolysin activation/secretion protein
LVLYSVPVHPSGLRFGASVSSGSTETTDSGLGQLKVEGRSRVLGVSLTQPLMGPRELEVDVSLNAQHITSSTTIAGFDQGDARTRLYSLGVQTVYRGTGHLVSAYTAINGGSYQGPFGASRSVRTVNSTGSWAMVLSEQWWLNTRAGVQWSSGVDIPATVKFSLGNPTDVRGYPASVVFGDKGLYLSLEAHRRFSDTLDVFAFTDNGVAITKGVPRQTLSSVGLGLNKSWGRQWTLSGSVAHAVKEAVPGQSSVRGLVRLTWQFQ